MHVGALVNGSRIEQARLAAGMSRTQLANAVQTSDRNIHRWINGSNQPSVQHLVLIARATGHDLEFFLTADGEDDDEEAADAAVTRDEKALRLSQVLLDILEEA
jgi:transcriptional regulator with XRE-family HTH domain